MPLLQSLSDGMEKLRSNPVIVALVLLIAAVTTLASFTNSVSKLTEILAPQTPGAARAELSKLGIPFTPESLQEKARDGDLVAVRKLLQAGLPADAVAENAGSDDDISRHSQKRRRAVISPWCKHSLPTMRIQTPATVRPSRRRRGMATTLFCNCC